MNVPSNRSNDWPHIAAIAAHQHGVFHRSQTDMSARQLRAAVVKGLLTRPLSDVFVFRSSPRTFRQRCSIASQAGAAISHQTAAALHQLDGFPETADRVIEVCFPRDHKRNLPGYVVHTWRRTSPRDLLMIDGIRTTSVARTLVQLGLRHDRAVVEAALDSALRKGVPARWIESTAVRLNRPGPTGQHVLAEIIADPARSGVLTESLLEALVERAIADPELPAPVRQYEVHVESGPRRFDLAFPEARLGIEAHSRMFHFGPGADEADNLRDFELAAAGWEVLYVTWGMAHQPALFMRFLKRAYKARAAFFLANASGL